MSYNITSWRINNIYLELPLTFAFRLWLQSQPEHDEKGYENTGRRLCLGDEDSHVSVELTTTASTWKLTTLNSAISGTVKDGKLIAENLDDWTGDFTGILYNDILIPLFNEFKGSLDALIVWEGGDSIVQLNISNGIVAEKQI